MNMVIISCFKLNPEVTAIYIRVLTGTLVVDGYHIAAHIGNDGRYALQLPGLVDQLDV